MIYVIRSISILLSLLLLIPYIPGIASHIDLNSMEDPLGPAMPVQVIWPVADATINESSPNSNYGRDPNLYVGTYCAPAGHGTCTDKNLETVMRFSASIIVPSGYTLSSAKLRLYVSEIPSGVSDAETYLILAVYPLSLIEIPESSVTWRTHGDFDKINLDEINSVMDLKTVVYSERGLERARERGYADAIIQPYDIYSKGVVVREGSFIEFDVTPYIRQIIEMGVAYQGFLIKMVRGNVYSYVGPPHNNIAFYSKDSSPPYLDWRPSLRITYAPLFSLSVSPTFQQVTQGGVAKFAVSINRARGFSDPVSLTVGPPPGSRVEFIYEVPRIVMITTSSSTPPGDYSIYIEGSGGGLTYRTYVTLRVLKLAVPTTLITIPPPTTTGTTRPVTGTESTTTTAVPTTLITIPPPTTTGTTSAATESTTGAGTTRREPTFIMDVLDTPVTLRVGEQSSFRVTISSFYGFSDEVTLTASNLPQGVSITSDTNRVPPNSTARMTLSASPSVPPGNYTITIIASGGGLRRSSTLSLKVLEASKTQEATSMTQSTSENRTVLESRRDFSIKVFPESLSINTGSSGSVAVTINWLQGNGTVKLNVTGLPPDARAEFNPSSLSEGTSSLVIRAGSTQGTFTVIVTGSSGGITRRSTFQLQITGGESRCLIATAAYGSELAPQVSFLRKFRDEVVMSTYSGSRFLFAFNSFYYSWSPKVSEIVRSNSLIAELTRYSLSPLLATLSFGTEVQKLGHGELSIILMGILVSIILGFIYLAPLSLLIPLLHKPLSKRVPKAAILMIISSILYLLLGLYAYSDIITIIFSSLLVLSSLLLIPCCLSTIDLRKLIKHLLDKFL